MVKRFTPILVGLILMLIIGVISAFASSDTYTTTVTQKFLEYAAKFDMKTYTLTSCNSTKCLMPFAQSYPHYQTFIKATFSSSESYFEALITLIDNKIWSYTLENLPPETVALTLADSLTIAKNAVDGYRTAFNANHAGEFSQMISTAIQTGNSKIENASGILEISYGESNAPAEFTCLRWLQKINGQFTTLSRSITISLSKTGLVTRFIDNINHYQIGATNIKTSKEEAIDIATPYFQEYASEHGQSIKKVNATFEFISDISSSRGDIFKVYPHWNIFATFDKRNEECVYGYAVMIWADNGQVYHHDPQASYYDEEAGIDPLFWVLLATVTIYPAVLSSSVYVKRRCKIVKLS